MSEIITIDGPAGSGKSTISKMLAKELDYLYLDTGAMYRAVALAALRNSIPLDQGEKLGKLCRAMDLRFETEGDTSLLFLSGKDISSAIRSPDMDMHSSTVSAVEEVRIAMTELQRRMASGISVVAEGRDMGTVVFPGAKHKFFLTAGPDVRAKRRYLERIGRGEQVTLQDVQELLDKRDRHDQSRSLAPLKPAGDALIIDSSDLQPKEVIRLMLLHIEPAADRR